MKVIFTKAYPDRYELRCIRDDESQTEALLEMKSFLKHDLMHFVVERTAGLEESFFGAIISGKNLDDVTPRAMREGRSSFGVEGQTTEIVVAILQGQYREKDPDYISITKSIQNYMSTQGLPPPSYLTPEFCRMCVGEHKDLMLRWDNLRIGSHIELAF